MYKKKKREKKEEKRIKITECPRGYQIVRRKNNRFQQWAASCSWRDSLSR